MYKGVQCALYLFCYCRLDSAGLCVVYLYAHADRTLEVYV